MQEEAFSELPFPPKDKSSKKDSVVVHPLSRSSINQEGLTLITGENRHWHCTQINFVTH